MSFSYGNTSDMHLRSCHPLIQLVFRTAIKHFDHSVLCGLRSYEEQERAFEYGFSTKHWPFSKHNDSDEEPGEHPERPRRLVSHAIDAAPYPIDWNDRERFTLFAGFILGIAATLGINMRWGGDWDRDTEVSDNNFDDLVHFELVNGGKYE